MHWQVLKWTNVFYFGGGRYLGMGLPDCMVNICLTVRNWHTFFPSSYDTCVPIISRWWFLSLHHLTNVCYCHSTILSSQLLRDGWNTVKLVNSMSTGPLLHFTCYELSSLMGRNAMSSASPWMVVLADALCAGEANPYPELSVYSSKKETLPFLLRKCSSVVATCHQVAGWSPWGVCPYQGLWWSLPLADLVTQIGLDVRFWV